MKGKQRAVGQRLHVPGLRGQLDLRLCGGYRWRGTVTGDSSRNCWHNLGGWQLGATEEIKGLNVFADWRIIASHSQNVAWQGTPAISGDVFPVHGAVGLHLQYLCWWRGNGLFYRRRLKQWLCFSLLPTGRTRLNACNWRLNTNDGKQPLSCRTV